MVPKATEDSLKRLILMRHAKSSWKHSGLSDHDRPLNKRGRRDSPSVANHLSSIGWDPQAVVSSTSQRTRETWALMAPSWPESVEVGFEPDLYLGGVSQIVNTISEMDEAVSTLMLLGHNPGWSDAAGWLGGVSTLMTTANAALLSIEGSSWSASVSTSGLWDLHEIIRPKNL